jgi:hypothetical protein
MDARQNKGRPGITHTHTHTHTHTLRTGCQEARTPGADVRALRHSRSHRVCVRWVSLKGPRIQAFQITDFESASTRSWRAVQIVSRWLEAQRGSGCADWLNGLTVGGVGCKHRNPTSRGPKIAEWTAACHVDASVLPRSTAKCVGNYVDGYASRAACAWSCIETARVPLSRIQTGPDTFDQAAIEYSRRTPPRRSTR